MDDETLEVIITSDLHFGRDNQPTIRKEKKSDLSRILRIKPDVVISAGDLTEYGVGKRSFFSSLVGCCSCDCCGASPSVDELKALQERWVEPIKKAGITLLLGPGNHDRDTPWHVFDKPVMKFIERRHGTTRDMNDEDMSGCYVTDVKGVRFLSMGIYPKNLDFLKRKLVLSKRDKIPVIIFYHYNTIKGVPYPSEKWSNFWSEREKKEFSQAINEVGADVIAIVNGHIHNSYKDVAWNGIPVFCAAGSQMIKLEIKDGIIQRNIFIPEF